MRPSGYLELLIVAVLVVLAALFPLVGSNLHIGVGLDMMMFAALAISWALFSGPTHYISLATAAFYGLGGLIVAMGMADYELPFWLMIAVAALAGGVLAALIGLATLRLTGVYFVIFTLGLAEMIRNLVSWIQNNFLGSHGFLIFSDFRDQHYYWMLLAVVAVVYLLGWVINRSRLGFALRIIGNDETVARHVGINTAMAKVILFTTTGFFAALVGAIVAPRWSYIEANQVFSPHISFLVVIMALLGGTTRLWAPIVGVVPFLLIWNWINGNLPNQSTLFIGVAFLLIVYVLPHGVVGRLEQLRSKIREGRS
ncbi:Branched-chain amino acid transport system permease protein LivM [Candidatus Rhodobacter oscarellae]|uniref:Branched-chain amino acid transport system permease protein LivM n=1 Tax=Candidatus Rhodobacter oscarellae TaxID=1675527 RepID=A0A0J9E3S4_9RHOB|nr:branched-chain amino acid ABC transporter permease [Candidatus Rhodobacter lobularis]KMW57456.1 Branched-chain amino acid transport system permease protein LivM [Candidatus Rhodobacter lobularis]